MGTAMRGNRNSEQYNIRVLDRAVQILTLLSDGRPRTLTEISEEIGFSNSTAFRLLVTLAAHHLVERDPKDGRYRLGLRCLELARAYHDSSDLRRVALPELERLRDETGETVHLAILDEMEVVYLEKLHGHHAIGLMSSRVGARLPAYCTGLGKILLAYVNPEEVRDYFSRREMRRFTPETITNVPDLINHLEEVRARGYALDRGEHEAEVRCVAAPVFDADGTVIAAISVSGPASRMDPVEANHVLIERTLQTAQIISTKLGYRRSASKTQFPQGGKNA